MTESTPPPPRRVPTLILLLITSIGVPGAVVAAFKDQVLQHPWITLAVLFAYEALVLIWGVVTDVWSRLRSKWVDRLADWVDGGVTRHISRYRRRYLQWIFYQHRDFDVKGLSTQGTYNLELEQVFVDLTLDPRPVHALSANPIQVPKDLAGRRQIWEYLTSETLEGRLALIGAPGSGKTTLLKKIALQMTGRKHLRVRQTVPILLPLREHAAAIQENPAYSLADAVKSGLARKQGPSAPAGWFESYLEKGRCLVLLDGLDEVAALDARQKVVAWVENQVAAFPRNQFLVTSRPAGYRSNPLAGFTVLEVQPFHREQIRRFVYNWYRANEIHASGKLDPGVEMKAREGAEDLLRRLGHSQALTDLSVNPLLLTMIATVHRFRSSLPGRRVELYAEICEVFLGKRQQARGMELDLTPAQKQLVLQPLAYHLMCTSRREIPLDEAVAIIKEPLCHVAGDRGNGAEAAFLKDTESGSGLLLERELKVYGFAHLVFQEYLAAVHAREEGLGAELIGKISESWWHETLRLYSAQADASPIVATCLESTRPTVAALSLAIDCIEEARKVDPRWRTVVDSLLSKGVEDTEPERFRLAAETLLARRLRSMVPVSDNTFVDSTYVTHAEYQLFLDEKRSAEKYHQPDHWQGVRFSAGQALLPVVGIRPSDGGAFCEWLSAGDSAFDFRLPQIGELESYGLNTLSEAQAGTAAGYWTASSHRQEFYRVRSLGKDLSWDLLEEMTSKDLALANALARDRALALARDRDRARDRAHVRDLDRVLVRALARDRALALDHDRTLDRTRTLDLDRTRAHVLDYVLDHTHVLDHVLDHAHAHARDLARARDLDLDLDRAHVLDHLLGLSLDLRFSSQDKFYQTWRWLTRILILNSAFMTSTSAPFARATRWFSRVWQKTRRDPQLAALLWMSLYVDLVILEARINGDLQPIEGLRIVKERRT